ncbi:uncharacterized protein [Henckelia pumila]|uniref:uncharacterized protein n=1 Tax=Henckelia pumila TaxID=405737 RepID=UPI003C6E39F4
MGCGESKHAVATANTSTHVTKSKSKRSDSNVVPAAPLQNASNESVNVKENDIPDAVIFQPTEDGKENTLANTENGESAEGGEGNPKSTSSDDSKEGDGAGGDHTSRNHEEESIASAKSGEDDDPAMKNGNQVVTNTIDENKASTASVGEEKTHDIGEKESADDATSTTDTKAN